MKITRIESLIGSAGGVAVVRVYTDAGIVGLGQTGWNQPEITTEVLHRLVAPVFLGQNPWDLQSLVHRCLTVNYKFSGTFLLRALCGMETALWDLLGKATDQPVYRLVGGAVRSEIPVYASSMCRDTLPEEEAERLINLVAHVQTKCLGVMR